jgi:hypothetical protein
MAVFLTHLREVADVYGYEKTLDALSSFSCKDKDVGSFLKTKAFNFDRRNKSRTYLVLDKKRIEQNKIRVLAYFTLSLKILEFDGSVSKTMIKNIDGISKEVPSIATLLIGQFGKDINAAHVSGDVIMNMCLGTIKEVQRLIGGRVVLVECLPIAPVLSFYQRHGFSFLQTDKNDKYRQMIKAL